MGIVAFFIVSILRSVFIEMGMGFGLFAIFGLLRLRTQNFTAKDMAYTFATFGIAVINALKLLKFPLLGVLIINVIIILTAYILEEFILKYKTETHEIIYDKLEFLKPDKKDKLLRDVSLRTGKEILKVKIRRINYKRNRALLEVSYKEKNHIK
jgi:multisubunit Na+/H+ antiporter MnhG subunit